MEDTHAELLRLKRALEREFTIIRFLRKSAEESQERTSRLLSELELADKKLREKELTNHN